MCEINYLLNMKNLFLSIILLATASCASIVSDSQYPVSINSSPSDAKFKITNQYGVVVHSGRTPAYINLDAGNGYFKKARYDITYQKRGYKAKKYQLTSTIDGWFWGNILFGGLVGFLIVDPLTGAMYKLPESVNVSLDDNRRADSSGLNIIDINSLSTHQKSKLVRLN